MSVLASVASLNGRLFAEALGKIGRSVTSSTLSAPLDPQGAVQSADNRCANEAPIRQQMNNIFMGSYTKDEEVYDYSGIWSRGVAGVTWKAIVRNADVVCRPEGRIAEDQGGDVEVERIITRHVESEIEEHLLSAPNKVVRLRA